MDFQAKRLMRRCLYTYSTSQAPSRWFPLTLLSGWNESTAIIVSCCKVRLKVRGWTQLRLAGDAFRVKSYQYGIYNSWGRQGIQLIYAFFIQSERLFEKKSVKFSAESYVIRMLSTCHSRYFSRIHCESRFAWIKSHDKKAQPKVDIARSKLDEDWA